MLFLLVVQICVGGEFLLEQLAEWKQVPARRRTPNHHSISFTHTQRSCSQTSADAKMTWSVQCNSIFYEGSMLNWPSVLDALLFLFHILKPRCIHDLSGVQDPFGIQRLLDCRHYSHSLFTEFPQQILLLTPADSMFTGTSAFHVESPLDQGLDACLDLGLLSWVVSIVHDAFVEVAIANMAEDARE